MTMTQSQDNKEDVSIPILTAAYQPLGNIQHEAAQQRASVTHMTPSPIEGCSREERWSRSTLDSCRKPKRYACQFDPNEKLGRSLVLQFDVKGTPSFLEMSRADILHLTREAAKPQPEENNLLDDKLPRRSKRRESSVGVRAEYATVCDVQQVHARDIRKLDNAFSVSNEPGIVLRKQTILFSADPIRAIIMRDKCLVFVPDGADSLLTMLKEQFADAVSSDHETAYEFKALEALLATLCRYFSADYAKTSPIVISALEHLAGGLIATAELETLRVFKDSMNEFESQVDGVRRCLMEILDNEEDLRLLYLTKLYEDPSLVNDLFSFDSEEAEVLIENYLQDIFSTCTQASLMLRRIQNTESLVMMKLDSARNYLLAVDVVFSLIAIGLAIGTYVTGAFGMNLNSGVQDAAHWFWSVVAVTSVVAVLIVLWGIWFFRKKGILRSQ